MLLRQKGEQLDADIRTQLITFLAKEQMGGDPAAEMDTDEPEREGRAS
jgi:hypothetical protein